MVALLFWLLLVLTASSAEPAWRDEFNNQGLDRTKWKLCWPQRWEVTNTLDNAEVSDGTLKIRVTTKQGVHHSCMLSTEDSLQRAYGYWETRVRFGDVAGTWSDAWLYTHQMHWARKGVELDIFEHRLLNWDASKIPEIISYGVHYNGYGPQSWTKGGALKLKNNGDGWHVFGLLATPEKYVWYLDGKEVASISDTRAEPLFLVLSTELQDWQWASRTLPYYDHVTLEVDYVRFYSALPWLE